MLILSAASPAAFVAAVDSNTALTLESPWPGDSATGSVYAIHRDFDPTSARPCWRAAIGIGHRLQSRHRGLSIQTASAVAGSDAVQAAQAARDDAEAARDAAAGSASAVDTDRTAVAADRTTVATDKGTVIAGATRP